MRARIFTALKTFLTKRLAEKTGTPGVLLILDSIIDWIGTLRVMLFTTDPSYNVASENSFQIT